MPVDPKMKELAFGDYTRSWTIRRFGARLLRVVLCVEEPTILCVSLFVDWQK